MRLLKFGSELSATHLTTNLIQHTSFTFKTSAKGKRDKGQFQVRHRIHKMHIMHALHYTLLFFGQGSFPMKLPGNSCKSEPDNSFIEVENAQVAHTARVPFRCAHFQIGNCEGLGVQCQRPCLQCLALVANRERNKGVEKYPTRPVPRARLYSTPGEWSS